MCGPSGAEKSLAGQESSFSNLLEQDFGTRFAGQNATLGNLNSTLQQIKQGNLLPGFSPATLAALNTAAINTTGANYANAARATAGQLAGRGGDAGLQSGVDAQIKAGIASSAAGQLSTQQQQITLANQQQAQQNTATYLGGMNALAGEQNPLGYAGAGTNANTAAYGEAQQNAMASSQQFADIAGGIAGIGGTVAKAFVPGASFLPGANGGNPPNPGVTPDNPYFPGAVGSAPTG